MTCRQTPWRLCKFCTTASNSADRKISRHVTISHKTLHDIGGAFHPPNSTVFDAAQAFTYFVTDLRALGLSMIARLHPSHGFLFLQSDLSRTCCNHEWLIDDLFGTVAGA